MKTMRETFEDLAEWIIMNEELFVRKLSDEDIEAYECGDDDFGDIVLWAERQLDMVDNLDDIDEDEEDWCAEECHLLERLIKENLKNKD